jgi:sugar phosphate isomerase/epimerase
MKLGIFAKTFAGSDPATVMAAASCAGYAAVQYNMACSGFDSMPEHISVEAADAVAGAAQSLGLAVVAVSGTYNMIHPDKTRREHGHARLTTMASRCKALSTRMITLCTGTRDPDDQWRAHIDNESPEAWSDLLASMEIAIGLAERYDIELGVEPELANVVNSPAKARKLIRELQSPRLRIILDPANLFEHATLAEQHHIVSSAIDLLGDDIAMGHAKDRAADGSFAAPGKGVIDFGHYLACLRRIGFAGPLVTHGLSADEAPSVADFLRRNLAETGAESI